MSYNFVVYKSSAGSGKTYTLVKEYLKLALADPHRLNKSYKQILAVTFTNKAAAEMKKDPSVKFKLSGYASAEGTDEHNMQLSKDRANAVKAYLVNSGVSVNNLDADGYGEANPIADNTTEAGRVINRRVEMKKE